jgi:hypothetical protein
MSEVYFIRPVGQHGPVKIGVSVGLERSSRYPGKAGRFTQIDACSPVPLEIAAKIPGDKAVEQRFHAMFEADHDRFEWFRWSPALQDVIDAVVAGAFDIDTLPAPKAVCHRWAARFRRKAE